MAVSELFNIVKVGRSPSDIIKRLATVCQDYGKLNEFRNHFKYFKTMESSHSHVMAPVFGRMESNEAYDFSCEIYNLLKAKMSVANSSQKAKLRAELHYWDDKTAIFAPWGLAGEQQRPIYTLYNRPNNELGIHKATFNDAKKALVIATKTLHPNVKITNQAKIPQAEKSKVIHAVKILNQCSYLKHHDSSFDSFLENLANLIK